MPLAWNEIRHRAIKFAHDQAAAAREAAEKQTFWNEFFNVFGIARKTVGSFEAPVKKLTGHDGAIDLFWPGVLLVEHKSLGGDLGKAQSQAFEYIHGLVNEGRAKEVPRYVIVSDFARVVLYDLEPVEPLDLPLFAGKRVHLLADFRLADLHKNIRPFAFIAGYQQQKLDPEDPANIEAAQIMATLHDALKAGGYTGHGLRQFLVRILFCLFAEDTGIFPQPRQLELYLKHHTAEDGSDLGLKLARLFEVLNTPEDKRQKHLEADLAEFPYINGDLFQEHLAFADFNSDMRRALVAASGGFRWEKISPAVFGSLFQDVMLPAERRQLGAHYTAEKNIMKVVRSLFLDDLRVELDAIRNDKSTRRAARLDEFHDKLARLTFLDPACGCGNFLVVAYRELRALELDVLLLKFGRQTEMRLDEVNKLSRVDVDQMFGIEIEEFPARIAEVALWLADHQANTELSIAFTQRYIRIPLRKSPHIRVGNALRLDWKQILPPERCSYILGNPPFVGKQFMTPDQNADMEAICGEVKGFGLLDYVTAWYFKAVEYIQGVRTAVGFVSTNSITQGEQVGILWNALFHRGAKIHFGHRTFAWESEARGKAHVHVVIVGFGVFDRAGKKIYDYEALHSDADQSSDQNPEPQEIVTISEASNINPYLVAGPDLCVVARSRPLCAVPEIVFGSMPNDGGFLLFGPSARDNFLKEQPEAAGFLRRFVGAEEFINGIERWCLWLHGESPGAFRHLRWVKDCIDAVAIYRRKSRREATRKLATSAAYFGEIRQPDVPYLLIPSVSSERRPYIPIGFMRPEIIASNLVLIVPGAQLYHFGILSSKMHMAWVRQVCGRLKSDYRYSNKIVYNNYPWPHSASDEQRARIEDLSQRIIDLRVELGDGRAGFLRVKQKARASASLADLYDPVAMPAELRKAHAELDRAVDRCYRKEPFPSDRARVEYLFDLYEGLTAPLLSVPKPKRSRPSAKPQ